jgi:hypothetical protein
MRDGDFRAFADLYDDVMGLYGKAAVATQKAMFFRALSAYSLTTVQAAFDAHVKDEQRGRFAPLPADLLAQIKTAFEADGRPAADEAWSIAITADDEASTVVWTEETAEAWGIARPVYVRGDEVGARMAFKAAYSRLVDAARARREPIRWQASIGHDEATRDSALTLAVEAGRLPVAYLPAPRGPVAGLLELSKVRGIPEGVRLQLERMREEILGQHGSTSVDAIEKERTAALKAEAAAKVSKHQGGEA